VDLVKCSVDTVSCLLVLSEFDPPDGGFLFVYKVFSDNLDVDNEPFQPSEEDFVMKVCKTVLTLKNGEVKTYETEEELALLTEGLPPGDYARIQHFFEDGGTIDVSPFDPETVTDDELMQMFQTDDPVHARHRWNVTWKASKRYQDSHSSIH
jgi:hypothetical protein